MMDSLAIRGGKPARSTPLPPNYPGAVLMGEEEALAAAEVVKARSPFRYYGIDSRHAVETFENMMAEKLQVPYVLGVSSCTAALITAMKALGIGYGDKVIVPAVTFMATAGAVVCCNAVPVFADVDESLNLASGDLERVYDEDVKAIITVPVLGSPCHMEPILEFARRHNLYVIEDVAQSCGVTYKGRMAGTMGDIGVFSFQMNKILTSGEGGAIVTKRADLFERAVRYHDQGLFRQKERYGIETDETAAFTGQNYRMSELAGAVLVEQWRKLDFILEGMKQRHSSIVSRLRSELPSIRLRAVVDEEGDIGSSLGIILSDAGTAQSVAGALGAENISAFALYGGKPVYMLPQFFHQRTADKDGFPYNYPFKNPVRYTEDMCPRAVDLLARTLFIPVSPLLGDQDEDEIVDGLIKVLVGLNVLDR